MAYIRGEGRSQGTLFPVMLDDLIPADPMCRAVDALVEQLAMDKLGFERAQPADTGRPGYLPSSAPIDFSFNCPLFTLSVSPATP